MEILKVDGDMFLALYNNFADNNHCGEHDTDELKLADQELVFYLDSLDLKDSVRKEIRELVFALGSAAEQQGFIYGVATGLRLVEKADEMTGGMKS